MAIPHTSLLPAEMNDSAVTLPDANLRGDNYRRAYAEGKAAPTEYGVTTGFGSLANVRIAIADPHDVSGTPQRLQHLGGQLGQCFPFRSGAA